MAPTTQKALVLLEEKGEWTLVEDWAVQAPGPKEVLVKNLAVAINPAEWKIQTHGAPFAKYPFCGGLDGAGVVVEVGSEVTALAKGDKVVFPGGFEPARATWKEYSVSPAENVAKIPDNITLEQAASIPVALATVATGIWPHSPASNSVSFPAPWEEGGLTKFAGKAAFIIGGASSVGQYAIQLAKLQGFSPIITTASPRNADHLKSLGATHVLDRALASSEILETLPKLTDGKPVVYAFDTVSSETTQQLAYDALPADGSLVLTIPMPLPYLDERIARDGGSKKIAKPFASFQLPFNREVGVEVYKRLPEWLKTGVLKPNRVEVVPGGLLGIPTANERMKNGQVSGTKLVVKLADE